MSADDDSTAAGTLWKSSGKQYIKGHPAKIARMIDETPAPTDADPEFVAEDISIDRSTLHGLIESLRRVGALKQTRYEFSTEAGGDNRSGSRRNHYRWTERAYADITAYLDSITTFPDCEHRVHIYNPPGSDADTLACKECGTEYHKGTVAELL